jgi:hypothetical protein
MLKTTSAAKKLRKKIGSYRLGLLLSKYPKAKHHNVTSTAVLASNSLGVNADHISPSATIFKARPPITQQYPNNFPANEP